MSRLFGGTTVADDDTNESNDSDDTINYRGEIDAETWREFKTNVPRTKALYEKINELIEQFNEQQRDTDNNNGGE